jgi:Putative zinc-finger
MTAEMGCDQVQELASELALGIAAGEERDRALRHLSGCPGCRRLVAELSSVGDELLLLAPERQPPPGFESRVLADLVRIAGSASQDSSAAQVAPGSQGPAAARVPSVRPVPPAAPAAPDSSAARVPPSSQGPAASPAPPVETGPPVPPVRPVPRPRSAWLAGRRRWLVAAVAAVLAASLGAGTVVLATADDRRLADSYRSVLGSGQGSFFAAAPLRGPGGRAGTVFGYQGRPSWLMVTLQPAAGGGRYQVQAVTRDGRYLALGEAVLGGGQGAWGAQLPVDLPALRELRLLAPDGHAAYTATFDATSPWGG